MCNKSTYRILIVFWLITKSTLISSCWFQLTWETKASGLRSSFYYFTSIWRLFDLFVVVVVLLSQLYNAKYLTYCPHIFLSRQNNSYRVCSVDLILANSLHTRQLMCLLCSVSNSTLNPAFNMCLYSNLNNIMNVPRGL